MSKVTKKSVIGVSIAMAVSISAIVAGLHFQKQNRYAYNAAVVEKLTTLPFETKALTEEQKSKALDVNQVKNRALVTAGLAQNYDLPEFTREYVLLHNENKDSPKDEFEARRRSSEGRSAGEEAFRQYRAEFGKTAPRFLTGSAVITLGRYDFKAQAFNVRTPQGRGGPFPAAFFRNIGDPGLVRGAGSSSLERTVSATRAYQVSPRMWAVRESVAKDIDTERFAVYAKSYFDTLFSTSTGKGLMLYCVQVDLFADPGMTIPLGSQGCNSFNVTRL